MDVDHVASGEFYRGDPWSRVFLILGVVSLVLAAIIVAIVLTRPPNGVWDPLGDYPTQHVLNPTIQLSPDATVDVIAKKCAKKNEVMVRGDKLWVAVTAPGTRVGEVGGASSTRYKSCGPNSSTDHYSYHQPIPSAVQAIARSGSNTLWRITGTDTPFDPKSGREGVPRTWTTETFRLEK